MEEKDFSRTISTIQLKRQVRIIDVTNIDELTDFLKHNFIALFYNQLEPGTIQQLTVTVLSNTSVNISWEPLLLTNGIILYYDINIRSLQLTVIKAFNHSVSIEPTKSLYQLIKNLS